MSESQFNPAIGVKRLASRGLSGRARDFDRPDPTRIRFPRERFTHLPDFLRNRSPLVRMALVANTISVLALAIALPLILLTGDDTLPPTQGIVKFDIPVAPTEAVLSLEFTPELTQTQGLARIFIEVPPGEEPLSLETRVIDDPTLPLPAGSIVDKYLRIDLAGAEEPHSTRATVEFEVSNSWLLENQLGISDIRLFRLSGDWTALPTEHLGPSGGGQHFRSATPGFSHFAIGGMTTPTPTADPTE